MAALTKEAAFTITETQGVIDCAAAGEDEVSLNVREEPPAFIITKLKKDNNGMVQEYTSSLLHEIFAAAKTMDIELDRSHFIFEEFGTTGLGNSAAKKWTAASQMPLQMQAEYNKPAQKLYELNQNPPPRSAYPEALVHSGLRRSLQANNKRLVERIKEKLGPDYQVEFGVFDEKPAINITPSSLIEEILAAVGILQPEKNKDVAKAVMQSFAEILDRAPEKGDITIAGERVADVLQMELAVPARERTKSKGRSM